MRGEFTYMPAGQCDVVAGANLIGGEAWSGDFWSHHRGSLRRDSGDLAQ